MSAQGDAMAALVERLALTMTATVYTGSTWSTVVKTGLKCSLNPVPRQPAASGAGRTELASRGQLEWERSYVMPVGARVQVDAYGAQRWSIIGGTVWPALGLNDEILNYYAEVTKAG